MYSRYHHFLICTRSSVQRWASGLLGFCQPCSPLLYSAPQGLAVAHPAKDHIKEAAGCSALARSPPDPGPPSLSPPVHLQHEGQVPRHEPASPRRQRQRALDRAPASICPHVPMPHPSYASTAGPSASRTGPALGTPEGPAMPTLQEAWRGPA